MASRLRVGGEGAVDIDMARVGYKKGRGRGRLAEWRESLEEL